VAVSAIGGAPAADPAVPEAGPAFALGGGMPLGPALALGAVGGALVGCLTDVAATDALAASVAACSVSIVVEPWRQRALWRALLVAGVASATMLHGAVARDRAFRGTGLFSTD
jgi:hypothetical protein